MVILNCSAYNKGKRAFTLIELMVTISIIVLLSGILIGYSHSGEPLIALFKEQTNIVNAFYQARSLAIATFGEAQPPCGYGLSFSQSDNSFVIFKDLADDCQKANKKYDGPVSGELFESFNLNKEVRFKNLSFQNVVFVPPDPTVYITDANSQALDQGEITIETIDGKNSKTITITKFGQLIIQ